MSVSPVTRLQEAFLMQHFYTEDAAEESRKYRMGKDLPSSPRKNMQTVKGTRLRPRSDRKPQESLTTNCAKSTAGKPDGQDGINTYLIHPIRKRHFRYISPESFSGKRQNYFFLALAAASLSSWRFLSRSSRALRAASARSARSRARCSRNPTRTVSVSSS